MMPGGTGQRLGKLTSPARLDRLAGPLLALAIAAYAGLTLYLTRGVIFTADEIGYVGNSTGWAPGDILHPHNGHAIAVTRVIYEFSLNVFGTAYLPIRLSIIAAVALTAWLLFIHLSRRVGRTAAFFPAVILLFAGANPVLIQGPVMMFAQATAAGIGALVMLDRRDRNGDLAAAVLLLVAVFSIEVGVGFAAGVVLWLLIGGEWRRAWVGVLPLIAYGIWFLWAQQFDHETGSRLSNVLLAPAYGAESLAAALGSYFGLAADLTGAETGLTWGRVLAAVAVTGLIWGALRNPPRSAFLVPIGILLVLWVGGAMVYGPLRSPTEPRYLMAVTIAVLLLAGEILNGWRPNRAALAALLAVAVIAIPGGLHLMKSQAAALRALSESQPGYLVALELHPEAAKRVKSTTAAYIRGVERWGSLTISPGALPGAAPSARAKADETLGLLLGPQLVPVDRPEDCAPAATGEVELPAGGAVLVSRTGGEVTLRRFADPGSAKPVVARGALAPGAAAALTLPADASPVPWKATVAGGEVRVCELDGSEAVEAAP